MWELAVHRETTLPTPERHCRRRACTYEKSQRAGVSQLHNYFIQGYDMVSANAAANVLHARLNVNQSRGVTPP